MAKVDGGELVARIIQENKARYCFAINGGHLFPILAQLRSHSLGECFPVVLIVNSVKRWQLVRQSAGLQQGIGVHVSRCDACLSGSGAHFYRVRRRCLAAFDH